MHSVLFDLLRMGHPHGSISSVLIFLWCLWKARNDFLFDRKKALPHQVHIAALALASDCYDNLPCLPSKQDQAHNQLPPNQLIMKGRTLKTDLLIVGPKIYSDAAYRTKKVPGLLQGEVATGVGVYITMNFNQKEINVQVQASAPPATSFVPTTPLFVTHHIPEDQVGAAKEAMIQAGLMMDRLNVVYDTSKAAYDASSSPQANVQVSGILR